MLKATFCWEYQITTKYHLMTIQFHSAANVMTETFYSDFWPLCSNLLLLYSFMHHAYFRSTKVTEIVAIFLTLNHCKESFNLVTTIPLSRSLSLFGNVFLQLLLVCQNRHQTVARNSIKRCFCCLVLQDRCRIARQYCCSFGSCIVISPKNLQVLQQ